MQRSLAPRKLLVVVVLSLLALFASSGGAQSTTPALTPIGNQASATYTDGSQVVRTVTSNLVTTTVQQVGGVNLTAPQAKTASPGAQVVYSHTLTNYGNAADTFTLSVATGGTVINTGTAVYMDANNDGTPDNNVNLATGTGTVSLAAGASVHLLVVGTVPVSATAGQSGTMTVTANSVFDTTQTQSNIDTTTVSSNAVINVTKSLSASSGASPSGPYTVTLTYTNNGNATATAVTLKDVIPAGMTYVSGTARWSVTGSGVALTETGVSQPAAGSPSIKYSWTSGTSTALAIIDSVPVGTSGQLTFSVNIASGLAPGPINNIAYYNYNDGNSVVPSATTFFNTNTATFTVAQSAGVTISTPTPIASATQGATISFTNTVTNTGNGNDLFNITLSPGTTAFPAGTSFTLYKSDGVTLLLDSNGDGIADIGSLAKNGTYNVVVKATLPPGATGGPYSETVTATSTVTGTVLASASDVLTLITGSTVDMTADGHGTGSKGLGPYSTTGGGIQDTIAVNPGSSAIFTLYVSNTSSVADTYNLNASTSYPVGTGGNTLPAGWSLTFTNGTGASCTASTLGSTITNTGIVLPGDTHAQMVCAVVTIPASGTGSTPTSGQPIYFQATSPTTGAADTIYNAVSVNTVHNLTLSPNNTGQVYPGGTVVYTHSLTNNGNVSEVYTTVYFTSSVDTQANWTSVLFRDNGSTPNVLDSTDSAVTAGTAGVITVNLDPGKSVTLFTKVAAPTTAAAGAVDSTTITITYNGTMTAVATDASTVIAGDLRLVKTQALDTTCNLTSIGTLTFSSSTITTNAKPGTCLFYQITATNQGSAAVSTISLSDATPTNTTYLGSKYAPTCTVPSGSTCGLSLPTGDGTIGTVTAAINTLAPGASAVLTFEVKINN